MVKPLRIVLRINGISCLLFGGLFLFEPATVSGFLGAFPAWVIVTLGVILLVNGIHLVFASLRKQLNTFEIIYFAAGDIGWALATFAVLVPGLWITNGIAIAAALLVASGVGVLGLTQVWLISEAEGLGVGNNSDYLPRRFGRGRAIAASWLSMKLWVKVWLFALNGIFLSALAFWPNTAATAIVAGYVASGPLLFAFMVWQRGLTRLLGLAHLIPWLPMLAYLGCRLTSDTFGPQVTFASTPSLFAYTNILILITAICLMLDLYDVVRWIRGERFRLGAKAAADARASALA